MPSIVNGLWIGEELSVMEQLCMTSFLRNGHTFRLHTYNDVRGVPEGVELRDANEVAPFDATYTYRGSTSPSCLSNFCRYRLLAEHGGYWVDTDVICLRPLPEEPKHLFAGQVGKRKRGRRLEAATCLMKAPAGSELMSYCRDACESRDPREMAWGTLGPELLAEGIDSFGMHGSISPAHFFCPVNWYEWREYLSGFALGTKMKIALRKPYAVHLWNEMWRRDGVDKDASFPGSCIYEKLKRRYLDA